MARVAVGSCGLRNRSAFVGKEVCRLFDLPLVVKIQIQSTATEGSAGVRAVAHKGSVPVVQELFHSH